MKTHLHLVFLFLANAILAQQDSFLVVEDSLRVYPLEEYTTCFVDSAGTLTIDEILLPDFQGNFGAIENFFPEGKRSSALWLRIPFVNQAKSTKWKLVLKRHDPIISGVYCEYLAPHDFVDVYAKSKNGIKHYQTGFLIPESKKTIVRNIYLSAVLLDAPEQDSVTLFVRLQNKFNPQYYLAAELRPQHSLVPYDLNVWGNEMAIYIGVACILALLSFFFFLFVKDWSYLFFGIYALLVSLHYSILHPDCLFVSWFIPEHPWLKEYCWVVFTRGCYLAFIFFGRSFVNLRSLSKRVDNMVLIFSGIIFLLMVYSLVAIRMNTYQKIDPSVMMIFIGVVLLGVRIFFLPSKLAKIFGVGTMWFCAFTIMGILWETGVLPIPFNPWPVAYMGVMVIYTIGLAYKLRANVQAKIEADRVLELDAVKSRFFANISHEFRTPLTLILGPLKKAQEQLPASEQDVFFPNGTPLEQNGNTEISIPSHHVGMMRRNAERLQQLIDQLLDLSKLENGSMKLQVAEGDVVQLVRAMVLSFESLAERRQIHFQTEFPPSGEMAYFDKDKLEKIIVNLLSNAFKFTSEKGRVSVKSVLENGRLKVSVEDSGTGISKEDLDKIFDRFYQVEGTEDKGTGIGLSLVKELVELHKGQISVDSSKGKGTTFKVSLPVGRGAFMANEIVSSSVYSSSVVQLLPGASINGQDWRADELKTDELNPLLLIVEDNPDLRRFIAETMQDAYNILTAENGKIGLEIAIEKTPDLIISDVMMPEMDGFTMCETLKKDERSSHIPIILLTAKAGQQHKIEGLETGADDYLTKPFDEKELLVRARNLVEQRRRLQERFAVAVDLVNFKNMLNLKPAEVAVTSTDQRFLEKVTAAIEQNMDNEFFSVEDLASEVAFSRSQLHRKLKALIGKSPNELIREFRLTRAKELLEKGHGNISEVAMEVGYSSLSYFTRSFKAAFGISPSEM